MLSKPLVRYFSSQTQHGLPKQTRATQITAEIPTPMDRQSPPKNVQNAAHHRDKH